MQFVMWIYVCGTVYLFIRTGLAGVEMIIPVCLWTGFISSAVHLLMKLWMFDFLEARGGWSRRDSQCDAGKQMHELSESVQFITPQAFHRQLYVRTFKTTWDRLKLALFTFLMNVTAVIVHRSLSPFKNHFLYIRTQCFCCMLFTFYALTFYAISVR